MCTVYSLLPPWTISFATEKESIKFLFEKCSVYAERDKDTKRCLKNIVSGCEIKLHLNMNGSYVQKALLQQYCVRFAG